MITRQEDALVGTLIGLAVGDALGAPVEFMQPRRIVGEPPSLSPPVTDFRTGGQHQVCLGEWTDDTAMAVALGEALVARRGFDATSIMDNWLAWYRTGAFGTRDWCFDIGNSTSGALDAYMNARRLTGVARADSHGARGPWAAGNGGIMRLAPAVVFAFSLDLESEQRRLHAIDLAVRQSHLTHSEPECDAYAARLGALLHDLIAAKTEHEAEARIDADYGELPESAKRNPDNSGYVKTTYQAAIWAVATTSSFEAAVLRAVNLGGDADTIGAVAGQIAGACRGAAAIPERWREHVVAGNRLNSLAVRLSRRV